MLMLTSTSARRPADFRGAFPLCAVRLRALLSLLALLVLAACGYDQTLVVIDVAGIPNGTASLHVQASLDGRAAGQAADFTQDLSRFGIRVDKATRGTLQVAVEARDASGCVLGRGQGDLAIDGGREYALTIDLVALSGAQCELRVEKTGAGGGVVQAAPANINCGAACQGFVTRGQSITLTAQADGTSHFLGWSGLCSGTSDCTVSPMAATTIKALFVKRQTTVCPQGGFCWENPRQLGVTQNRIWGTSVRDLWVAGAGGTILHWDGASWLATPAGSAQNISRVWGVPGGDVWAVGGGGTILRFREGAWAPVASGVQSNLMSIFGVAANDLWAVGVNTVILHWDGTAWTAAKQTGTPTSKATLNGVWGAKANDLWAVGGGGTAFHYDGQIWTLAPAIGTLNLQAVAGSSSSDIWATSSDGTIVRYNGSSWQNHTMMAQPINDVSVTPTGQAWVVGGSGLTMRWETTKWTQYLSNVSQELRGVWLDPSGDAWAVGAAGTMLRWASGAWSNLQTGVRVELRDAWAASPDDVWVVGAAGALLHGVSGTWTPVAGTSLDCDSVTGQNASNVWAACQNNVLKWNGATWAVEYMAPAGVVLSSLWTGGGDVWAVATNGTTYRRRTGSWAAVTSPTTSALYGASGNGQSDVWAAGFNSTVLHGDGNTWTVVPTTGLPTTLLYSILAMSPTDVWVVGTGGLIGHYDGTSWTSVTSPTTALLRHIHGSAGNDLWTVGAAGTVLHWDGAAWSSVPIGTDGNLRAVWPLSGHTWIVGESGAILHKAP